MLDAILGSKTKVRVLRLLFRTPTGEFALGDMTDALVLSIGSVHPAVRQLVESRMLVARRVGRSRAFRLNERHVLYAALLSLFGAEGRGLVSVAQEFAKSLPARGTAAVVLFGSAARGVATPQSDIDVLVVAERSLEPAVRKAAESILDRYDVNVSPLVLPKEEVDRRLRAFDPLLLTVAQEGKTLRGRAAWLAR